MSFGEAYPKKHLKLKGGAMVWLRYSFSLFSFLPFIFLLIQKNETKKDADSSLSMIQLNKLFP